MAGTIVNVGKQEYVLASRKRRALAGVVDFSVAFGPLFFLGDYGAVFILPALAYLFMGDGILRGQRLGKRLLGLKVIDARHGTPCTPFQDFIRNCGRASVFSYGGLGAILRAYDHAVGNVPAQPEIYVILTRSVTDADRPPAPPPEKPAKLDLEGMKGSWTKQPDSPGE
jgi:hypothetical protein